MPKCKNKNIEPNSDRTMPKIKQIQKPLIRVDQLNVDISLI